jgi:hypothetical protein
LEEAAHRSLTRLTDVGDFSEEISGQVCSTVAFLYRVFGGVALEGVGTGGVARDSVRTAAVNVGCPNSALWCVSDTVRSEISWRFKCWTSLSFRGFLTLLFVGCHDKRAAEGKLNGDLQFKQQQKGKTKVN